MHQATRVQLSPWIQSLILSFDPEQDGGGSGDHGDGRGDGADGDNGSDSWLKAEVMGVGPITASQTQTANTPSGLLFLSDGAVQIPAVLTAAAWERLQEMEDREYLDGLLNVTVCLQDSRLHFHFSPKRSCCRFYMTLGRLVTVSGRAGGAVVGAPCCTTLPAVRDKISTTWRWMKGRHESQRSQSGLELSSLLGVWQQQHLQDVLDDVRRHLMAGERPDSPQPSTSTAAPPQSDGLTHWDLQRIRYKSDKAFSVPVRLLLLPLDANGNRKSDGDLPPVGVAERRIAEAWKAASSCESSVSPVEDEQPRELPATDTDLIDSCQSQTWDAFPTPSVSVTQPVVTPPPWTDATAGKSEPPVAVGDLHSFLPPYQKPLTAVASTSRTLPASDGLQGASERPHGQRKRSEDSAEALATLQEGEGLNVSPPSWLFNSLAATASSSWTDGVTATNTPCHPSVHSDGTPFSYSYPPTGQNLQDLSRLRVGGALLQWAVRYLVIPKGTDRCRHAV